MMSTYMTYKESKHGFNVTIIDTIVEATVHIMGRDTVVAYCCVRQSCYRKRHSHSSYRIAIETFIPTWPS